MYIEKYSGDLEHLQKQLYPVIYDMVKVAKDELSKSPDTPNLNVINGTSTVFISNDTGRNIHKNPEFKEITDFILDACDRYFDQEEITKDGKQIAMSWVNVYPKGSYIKPHHHSFIPKICSAVFYLKSYDNSGRLFLKDQSYQINQGEVCFFPSEIEHWTSPNENEEDRIMIGYDIYYGKMSEEQLKILIKRGFSDWNSIKWS
jgi:hypothetical protein